MVTDSIMKTDSNTHLCRCVKSLTGNFSLFKIPHILDVVVAVKMDTQLLMHPAGSSGNLDYL